MNETDIWKVVMLQKSTFWIIMKIIIFILLSFPTLGPSIAIIIIIILISSPIRGPSIAITLLY